MRNGRRGFGLGCGGSKELLELAGTRTKGGG